MTIIQLKYMLLVAEHKNFTTAANKSFVTQPTLSIQIQKLEEELGTKIFNRNTKPVLLTEIGKKIVQQAQRIIEESSRMTDIVAQEKGFIGGEFKLGILPTVMLLQASKASIVSALQLILMAVAPDDFLSFFFAERGSSFASS